MLQRVRAQIAKKKKIPKETPLLIHQDLLKLIINPAKTIANRRLVSRFAVLCMLYNGNFVLLPLYISPFKTPTSMYFDSLI